MRTTAQPSLGSSGVGGHPNAMSHEAYTVIASPIVEASEALEASILAEQYEYNNVGLASKSLSKQTRTLVYTLVGMLTLFVVGVSVSVVLTRQEATSTVITLAPSVAPSASPSLCCGGAVLYYQRTLLDETARIPFQH